MTLRLGITGHRDLTLRAGELVRAALLELVAERQVSAGGVALVGVTCLADGADTLFAEAILDAGGDLHVVVPARQYRDALPPDHHRTYDRLLAQATTVHELGREASTAEAHMAASELLLGHIDELVAVWNGEAARGFGGTADVVDAARARHLPIVVVWPPGAARLPAPTT